MSNDGWHKVEVDPNIKAMSSGEHLYRMIKGLEKDGAKLSLHHRAWARCFEKYGDYFWTRKQAENELQKEEDKKHVEMQKP